MAAWNELDAFIGEAKHYLENEDLKVILIEVQSKLYRVMGQLSTKNGPILIRFVQKTLIP
jgi:cob(I)alamin adenosyltransferase